MYLEGAVGAPAVCALVRAPMGLRTACAREVLLHETAVAWVRRREAVTRASVPWTETVAEFGSRLRSICQHTNGTYDVEGLCRGFPKRVQAVIDAEGDRIPQ